MSFDQTRAAIRFGEGLSPNVAAPGSAAEMLAMLRGPDLAAAAFPIATFESLRPDFVRIDGLRREFRKGRNSENAEALQRQYRKALNAQNRKLIIASMSGKLGRSITAADGFRERLTRFWADHFTVLGRGGMTKWTVPNYVEEAIRPHLAGRFEDMLSAVMTHPMMLNFLDQGSSIGPNSKIGQNRKRGINENLARELLELHTLGVGAGYTQMDVRELAELLTGLSFSVQDGFVFRPGYAEPGAETVLGAEFGGGKPVLDDIRAALHHLVVHPATAQHIASKLATHFVSDTPDPALVEALASRFRDSGGDLYEVYDVLLSHPASWSSFGEKVKQPIDLVSSGYRALAVPPAAFRKYNVTKLRAFVDAPLAAMGQPWQRPGGPDGWPEEADAWITPQGLAARLQWAMSAPSVIFRSLPDPRDFLQTALGSVADERVAFAAKSAETRREGVGLILASPAFQRR